MASFQGWQIKERMSRLARAYQRAGRPVDLVDYAFEVDMGGNILAGSTVGPFVVKVPAEAQFVWLGNTLFRYVEQGNNGGSVERPNAVFVRIKLRSSGATLGRAIRAAGDQDREWIPIGNFAGSGRIPAYWPFPLILDGGEEIVFDCSNQLATAASIKLTLIGVQLYRQGAA